MCLIGGMLCSPVHVQASPNLEPPGPRPAPAGFEVILTSVEVFMDDDHVSAITYFDSHRSHHNYMGQIHLRR